MPLPVVYRKSGENVIATYDFTDIVEGSGSVEFYADGYAISGSSLYTLTRQSIPPATSGAIIFMGATSVTTNQTSFVLKMNTNFDSSTFNHQVVLKGTATAVIPIGMHTTSADSHHQAYAIVTYQKVDVNSAVTDIATTTLAQLNGGNAGTEVDAYLVGKTTIPNTTIKLGETLRVNLKVYTKLSPSGGGNPNCVIFHDPTNAAYTLSSVVKTAGRTRMSFHIPFKIDL